MKNSDPLLKSSVMAPPNMNSGDHYSRRQTVYRLIPPYMDFDESNNIERMVVPRAIGKPTVLRSLKWKINNITYEFIVSSQKLTITGNIDDEDSELKFPFETIINTEMLLFIGKPHRSMARMLIRNKKGNRIHLFDGKIQDTYEDGILNTTDNSVETT